MWIESLSQIAIVDQNWIHFSFWGVFLLSFFSGFAVFLFNHIRGSFIARNLHFRPPALEVLSVFFFRRRAWAFPCNISMFYLSNSISPIFLTIPEFLFWPIFPSTHNYRTSPNFRYRTTVFSQREEEQARHILRM